MARGMVFMVDGSVTFHSNQLLCMGQILEGSKGRPFTALRKKGMLELVGAIFCGLSACSPGLCQVMMWAKRAGDEETYKAAERMTDILCSTNTALGLVLEMMKEARIWPHERSIPLNEEAANLLARSMGLENGAVLKAALEESAAAKKEYGEDNTKAMDAVYTIAKAASKVRS